VVTGTLCSEVEWKSGWGIGKQGGDRDRPGCLGGGVHVVDEFTYRKQWKTRTNYNVRNEGVWGLNLAWHSRLHPGDALRKDWKLGKLEKQGVSCTHCLS
jgi:hypothetical protein